MTETEIIKGFWYWNREENWPPNSITYIEDICENERLNLNITQLGISQTEQRKLVKKWCQELPKIKNVKYLWLCSKVSQEIFESICEIENLEGLYIKWSGIKDINSLKKLKNLKHLHFGSSSQIEGIEILKEMANLITLNIEQFNKVTDFSILSKLTELEGLGIDGSMWTSQKIESFNFVEKLNKLKYLTFTNSSCKDKSFEPFLKLENLIRLNCSWNYPEKEFNKLKTINNLKYGNVETNLKELMKSIKIT